MQTVIDLLNIASPTGSEEKITDFVDGVLRKYYPDPQILKAGHSLICTFHNKSSNQHVIFVGHTDVVPKYFESFIKDGKLFGAGASDMKGALGVYLQLLQDLGPKAFQKYDVSFVFYDKEEQTPMQENGLFALIQKFPDFFKTVDLAIVGEPTDSEIHLGCLGSLHIEFRIQGVACHSARPWNGENAVYKALPVLQKISTFPGRTHKIFGVDFQDVLQITELSAEAGRTSLPGWLKGNVNFRFAPVRSEAEARVFAETFLQGCGLRPEDCHFLDSAPAGQVVESDLLRSVVTALGKPVKAKQAWTDVAQLSALGIPAFNFGPGLTSQAHKDDEYVLVADLYDYYETLRKFLTL